jgi:hypothetical protein
MPITKAITRNSSATVLEYASQQLFYLNDIHLLIFTSKMLSQLYFNRALSFLVILFFIHFF